MFYKKGVLKNFSKFAGKHLYRSLFFNKVAGFRPQKLLGTTDFIEHPWWLLLKFDIICLSEIYLSFNPAPRNDNLEIPGYNLIRSDHPSNSKRRGACIYNKNFLNLRVLDIQYLHECINIELKIRHKLCYVIALYRLRSQSQDEPEKFSEKLE